MREFIKVKWLVFFFSTNNLPIAFLYISCSILKTVQVKGLPGGSE